MMDRPHFEHRVFSASVSWTQSLLISPVLSTYCVPDLAPVVLSGGSGVVSVFLVGKQTQARAKLGSLGKNPYSPSFPVFIAQKALGCGLMLLSFGRQPFLDFQKCD